LANSVSFGMVDTRLTQAEDTGETIGGRSVAAFPREMREQLVQRIPLQRPATVEEAAGSIVFLLSDDANFITGHTLAVNGGRG
ncbi:MAG: SDR family oxidoreductase, partial [Chloroflexi bacterium]|nr:SDR family oxidoreductase [Chloroflexota bacterium]